MMMNVVSAVDDHDHYDRDKEVKQFDDSKSGVKGLVDSGIASIPRIFRHPPDSLPDLKPTHPSAAPDLLIPVVDLSGNRPSVVEQVRRAASDFGFFQIVNHGIPTHLLDAAIDAVRAFHEQPAAAKAELYRRDSSTHASFFSNFDLFHSKAASWRDTLLIPLAAATADPERIPSVCREEAVMWDLEMERLGGDLLGLFSEGLGLGSTRLQEMTCLGARVMVAHYYPYCPEPDLTVGIASHTDPGVLTVLLQNGVGGLRIKHGGRWVDVKPVAGALVINVGDLLQLLSNDAYKSVHHQVLANPSHEARVSIAVFINPSDRESLFGPLPELLSPEKPALYKECTVADFFRRFSTKGLDGKSLLNYFRLEGNDTEETNN